MDGIESMKNVKGRLILFGAGRNGQMALQKYGREQVAFFCDNDAGKVGKEIDGVPVVGFDSMLKMHEDGYVIMVTPAFHAYQCGQLAQAGIDDYLIFYNEETRFPLRNGADAEKKHKEYNKKLEELVAASCRCNPLEDISSLREAVREAKEFHAVDNRMLGHYGFHHESYYYGNMKALIDYAEIAETDIPYFPIVSHADSMPVYTVDYMYKTAVVMSGTYYRDRIHRKASWVPVFSVGPYIYYAKNLYSLEKIRKIKQRNGKTLLAFLPHSVEGTEKQYSYKVFVDGILANYGQKFDKILLCAYWADIDSMACSYAEERGIQVVSAGFRWDSQFDRRLRTLFELADAVVCGDMGTFIPYAIYMDKPIGMIDGKVEADLYLMRLSEIERKIGASGEYLKFMDTFNRLFHSELRIEPMFREFMNPFAGFDQIRNREYIRNILTISRDIWTQSDGDMLRYPEAVRSVYQRYEEKNEFYKMSILRESVGAYVD